MATKQASAGLWGLKNVGLIAKEAADMLFPGRWLIATIRPLRTPLDQNLCLPKTVLPCGSDDCG